MVFQKEIYLKPYPRGFHIISQQIFDVLPDFTGIVNVFIIHTSASLAINENADPSVREDLETHFNIMIPEDKNYYQHTQEGPDDMTSHIWIFSFFPIKKWKSFIRNLAGNLLV